MSQVYLAALIENNKAALDKIESAWPERHYKITDGLVLISVEGISTASSIAERIGITTDPNAPSGLVLSMNQKKASGVMSKAAVDWLVAAENA